MHLNLHVSEQNLFVEKDEKICIIKKALYLIFILIFLIFQKSISIIIF